MGIEDRKLCGCEADCHCDPVKHGIAVEETPQEPVVEAPEAPESAPEEVSSEEVEASPEEEVIVAE